MSCEQILASIDTLLLQAELTPQARLLAIYLLRHPVVVSEAAKQLGLSRSAAFRFAAELRAHGIETRVPKAGLKPSKQSPKSGTPSPEFGTPIQTSSPESGTQAVPEVGLHSPESGTPVPESGLLARVDSLFPSKEEEVSKKEKKDSLSRSKAPKSEPPGFAEFYLAYPRKVGRPSAAKAFAKALKSGADQETILEGLRRYRFKSDPDFQPHPSTWLNDERWKSEPSKPTYQRPVELATYL